MQRYPRIPRGQCASWCHERQAETVFERRSEDAWSLNENERSWFSNEPSAQSWGLMETQRDVVTWRVHGLEFSCVKASQSQEELRAASRPAGCSVHIAGNPLPRRGLRRGSLDAKRCLKVGPPFETLRRVRGSNDRRGTGSRTPRPL